VAFHWNITLGFLLYKRLDYDRPTRGKILGMIKRTFVVNSKEIIILLFKSLVRPHLEYCCQVWSPHYSKDIKLLEGVQRRATDRLKNLGRTGTSLENRRI